MKIILLLLLLSLIGCQTLSVRIHDITYTHVVNGVEVVENMSFITYSIDYNKGMIKGRLLNNDDIELYIEGLKIISIRHYGIEI